MLQKDEEIKLIKTEQLTYKEMIRSEVEDHTIYNVIK